MPSALPQKIIRLTTDDLAALERVREHLATRSGAIRVSDSDVFRMLLRDRDQSLKPHKPGARKSSQP
jgi:hypothetical protein